MDAIQINPEDHLRLVGSIAGKYAPKDVPTEDSEEYADGLIGLLAAIKKYDPEKHKTEFSTFATIAIKSEIKSGWRKRHRKKRFSGNNGVSLDETGANLVPAREEKPDVNHLIANLLEDHPDDSDSDKRNKRVLFDHYIEGKTWADIGRELKVSRACAQQYGWAALDLIRERFNIAGFDSLEEFVS